MPTLSFVLLNRWISVSV